MKTSIIQIARASLLALLTISGLNSLSGATHASSVSPTVKLLDESGTTTVSGASANVYMKVGSYYYLKGTTSNGALVVSSLTDGNSYDFYVDYNHGRKYFTIVAGTDSAFIQTSKVSVNLKNCNGLITSGSNADVALKGNIDGYYWNMGSTSSGVLNMYLLPATYDFRMDYNHGRNTQTSVAVSGSTQNVDFTATCTKITVSNCNGIMVNAQNPLSNISQSSPASFSLRRLNAGYNGYAINVRRSSDNATTDIGFTSNGDLDTTALKSFCGSSSGYVVKWYDQSGNNRDASQATTSKQPRIVDNGTVDRQNSQPAIRFLGLGYALYTGNFTAYNSGVSFNGVAKVNANQEFNAIVNKTGPSSKNVPAPLDFYGRKNFSTGRFIVGNGSSYTFIDHPYNFTAAEPLGIWTFQGTPSGSLNTFYNGSSNGSGSLGSSYSDGGQPLYIGSRADGYSTLGLDGWISEIVTFAAELSASDRQILEGSQAAFFGISGPAPSSSSTLTGNVSIKGNIDGYYWNMGNTTVGTGTLELNLLPNSYDVRMDYNHGRNEQLAVAVSGTNQTINFATTCVAVKINNCNGLVTTGANASVAVKGNIDGYFWNMGNTANGILNLDLLPNSYEFRMDYNHGRNTQTVSISGSSQTVNFNSTCVSVRVLDYNSNVINTSGASVAIKGNIDGYFWNMGTSVSGVVTMNLLGNNYDFRMDYNHGRNTQLAVAISGTNQNVDFATTRTVVRITDCNGAAISGAAGNVAIKGNIDGYYWNMGNTANGILDLDLLPETYDVSMSYNHYNNKTGGTTISGSTQNVDFTSTKVTISGSGITFKGNIDGYFWGFTNNSYLLTGNYTFKIGGVESDLTVTGCSMSYKGVVVKLLNSSGAGISGGVVDVYVSNWSNSVATTNASGNALVLFPGSVNNAYFRMNYANASQQLGSYNINTTPTVTFQTKNVKVELRNSANTLYNNEGTNVGYYSNGSWYVFGTGTTASGVCNMQLLPVNYYFRMTAFDQTQQQGSINIATLGATPTITFKTVALTLKLKDAAGTGTLEATGLGYYSNGNWKTFADGATNGAGTETMELLPGNYYFRMAYADQTQQQGSMSVSGTSQTVCFQTTAVTLKLKDAAGTGTHEATGLGYYSNGNWKTFADGATNGAGTETMELLPGNYYFRMTYADQTQQQGSMSVSGTSQTVCFQTTAVTLTLKDAAGTGTLDATNLGYYSNGSWHSFSPSVTTSGSATMDLLPGNYYFRMTYANQSQQKGSMSVSGTSQDVFFQTVEVTQHIDDGTNDISNASADYYASGTWYSFGTTDVNGDVVKELLPGNYYFRMSHNSYTKQKGSYTVTAPLAVNYVYTGSGISRIAKQDNKVSNVLVDGKVDANADTEGIETVIEKENTVVADSKSENNLVPAIGKFIAYPNPFNTTSTISYVLSSSQDVQLDVYSTNGVKVLTLAKGQQEAGLHTSSLNAQDLAEGLYYIRLITPTGVSQISVVVTN